MIISVSAIKMVAMEKARAVSPPSVAYTYSATVSVAAEVCRESMKFTNTMPKPAVYSSAALSLTMRPTAKMHPVTMPSTALGSTTVRIMCHLPAPKPVAPSR